MYLLVLTRSFACTLTAPICPFFAFFLISATSFFSCCSSFVRSRSSSRCVFSSARWCLRSRSAGVMRLPNAHSMICKVRISLEPSQNVVDRMYIHDCNLSLIRQPIVLELKFVRFCDVSPEFAVDFEGPKVQREIWRQLITVSDFYCFNHAESDVFLSQTQLINETKSRLGDWLRSYPNLKFHVAKATSVLIVIETLFPLTSVSIKGISTP